MCLQFLNHLISSPPSNLYKQTAQFSGGSLLTISRSWNLITGRISQIRRADTGAFSGIRVGELSGQMTSVSRKSDRPRK
ncbi:hypothetical protein AB3S75_025573 [Citrus x aurantiifolia]